MMASPVKKNKKHSRFRHVRSWQQKPSAPPHFTPKVGIIGSQNLHFVDSKEISKSARAFRVI